MSDDLPHLSSHDIRAQLEKHYRGERRHHLFAFYGEGMETTLDLSGVGRFHVVPVDSELDLREKLTAFEAKDARAAFLVPWSTEIPLDLAGRFARGGKVLRVGSRARLRRMFRVAEVEESASKSALARYLLTATPSASFMTEGGRLTEAVMWEAWLTQRYGLDAPGGLALDTLLGWAASDARGGEFVASTKEPTAAGVRDALLTFLHEHLGPAAPAVWRTWEHATGPDVLAWAVLCEPFLKLPDAARMWLRLKLEQQLGIEDTEEVARAAEELGASVGGALAYFSRRVGGHDRQKLLGRADALLDEPTVAEALHVHTRLPSAWRARLAALGRALTAGAANPSAEALQSATEAYGQLESHELFPEEGETNTVKRALMAVRLLAWLVARTDRRTEGQAAPYGDAVALGSWYAAEGGYVDWARNFARGSASDEFGRGVQAVVEAADEIRHALDQRFARGLAAWVEAKRPSSDVVPIDQALARVAGPFVKGDDDRRLLVLLMDGMAWAQAVEILQSLGERAMAWGPLAWHATADGRFGSAPVPVVFANLPTVTDVSRAAFFAGKPMGAGEKTSVARDPDRFEANRWMRDVCDGNTAPRLLLRAEGTTAGGAASQEALTLVSDPSRRVVGIVVNAIDASLKRDPQQHPRWGVDSIRPLADLLEAAQRAGRAILMASDHGHVPTDLLTRVGDNGGGGTRWRPWEGPGDTLAEGEIKIAGEGVWTPKGKEAVVLLTSDRQRYGSAPNAGEHGGASLAEVVAPCLLIGSATTGYDQDPAQGVVGAFAPDWWGFRVRTGEPVERAPKKPRRKKPDNQLELPVTAPVTAPPAVGMEAAAADLSRHPLAKSKLFLELAKSKAEQQEVLKAVDFLQARNGAAAAEAFAAAMGELAFRIPGLVSKLQGVLNVDGYQVLWFDHTGHQVRLDVAKLEQQFEVKV